MLAELERLAEKVERAKSAIGKLREDNVGLRTQCKRLQSELSEVEARAESLEAINGQRDAMPATVSAAMNGDELNRLRRENDVILKERDALLSERAEVTKRVRGLLGKVEKLEELS